MTVLLTEDCMPFANRGRGQNCSICNAELSYPRCYPTVMWETRGEAKDLFICCSCIDIARPLCADLIQAEAIKEMRAAHPTTMSEYTLKRVHLNDVKRECEGLMPNRVTV